MVRREKTRSIARPAAVTEPGRAAALAQRYAAGFPLAYRNGAGPAEAAIDIRLIHSLSGAGDKSIRIYRNPEDCAERLRLKLYSHDTIALSEVVPAFENFGFRVIEEMTTPIDGGALGRAESGGSAVGSTTLWSRLRAWWS